jgi:uracil-DNA glycosylase family 4
MKIEVLFEELKKITADSEPDFTKSGMINWYDKMKYGFFPLGFGILTEDITLDSKADDVEIAEGGVMVLGNDFGTVGYVKDKCSGIGETNTNKTINNLLDDRVGLNRNDTFFTNFYLGVRTHPDATMTKRVEELQKEYKKICYEFFLIQLKLLKPKTIICLGHDVKNALIESEQSNSFINWAPKSISIKKIHIDKKHIIESGEVADRKFVLIPHPCDLRNFNEYHMNKLNGIINN